MGVESVRQADIGNGVNSPRSAESEEIQIQLHQPKNPPHFDELTGYPYPDQEVVKGNYQFESSPRFGGPETGEGTFQIRTGSGMIILQTEDDRPRPKKIFQALDQAINGETSIKQTFVPNQNQVWNFLERADRYRELKVVTPNGLIKSANQVNIDWEEMKGRYPVEIAHLEFDFAGDDGPIPVRYRDDTLEIGVDDPDAREYVIQIFETVMTE